MQRVLCAASHLLPEALHGCFQRRRSKGSPGSSLNLNTGDILLNDILAKRTFGDIFPPRRVSKGQFIEEGALHFHLHFRSSGSTLPQPTGAGNPRDLIMETTSAVFATESKLRSVSSVGIVGAKNGGDHRGRPSGSRAGHHPLARC